MGVCMNDKFCSLAHDSSVSLKRTAWFRSNICQGYFVLCTIVSLGRPVRIRSAYLRMHL